MLNFFLFFLACQISLFLKGSKFVLCISIHNFLNLNFKTKVFKYYFFKRIPKN